MKKIMKLSKIFLLIVTVFSYIASPISVFAEEVITSRLKPLVLNLDFDEDNDKYALSYISANPEDYEDTTDYKIELETTITYTNGNKETVSEEISVKGSDLDVLSSKKLNNPISDKYNAKYVLEVSVYDDTTLVYNEELEYETEYVALIGLTGKVNEETNGELSPSKENVGTTTVGNYDVTEGKYTQRMSILPGELSPVAKYRVVYNNEDVITYSEVMTAEELALVVFEGTSTDLTGGKLAGTYTYVDSITFEEVEINGEEVTVKETYTYNYDAKLVYGTNNDELFTNMYNVVFMDGYMVLPAKGIDVTESVITIGELVLGLENTDIKLEVLDENGNKIYPIVAEDNNDDVQVASLEQNPEENSILNSEVKNGYVVKFTNGVTASYTVVVVGDANLDNEFTHEDLVGVIEGYINEEDMPSMDVISSNDANDEEEIGTITFEDVIVINELLKEEQDLNREEVDNENLELGFGDLPEEIYVGDTVELQVLLNKTELEEITDDEVSLTEEDTNTENEEEVEEVIEFIDGIDGTVKLSDNLKIKEVKFNEVLTGSYNEEGRVVAVGDVLLEDAVIMTLVLEVTSLDEGTASVELSGSTSKYLNIDEFDTITTEFEVIRRLSTNNNLSTLSASVGTFDIEFNSEEVIYTLTVPYTTESVELSGLVEDEYATVDGFGVYELNYGKATAIITVTAEDGTTKVYTVYIVKEAAPVTKPIVYYYYSSNNYLKSLEIDGYELEFDKYTSEYKITVKNDVTSLDISALAEDSRSRVEITGNSDFKVGENVVTITVIAENGSIREYKLMVEKEENTVVSNGSNTAEKIVIIVLIVLVVLGLLYLIFKKDDGDKVEKNKPTIKTDNTKNKDNTNKNNNKKDNKNNNKNNNKKKKK